MGRCGPVAGAMRGNGIRDAARACRSPVPGPERLAQRASGMGLASGHPAHTATATHH